MSTWTPPPLPFFGPWVDKSPTSSSATPLPPRLRRWEADSLALRDDGLPRFHAMMDYYGKGGFREHGAAIGGNNLWAGYDSPEEALAAAMGGFLPRLKGATVQETRAMRKTWRETMLKLEQGGGV